MVRGICSNCKKEKENIASWGKAQGLCKECYNSVFHIEKVKAGNKMKAHNIDYETYKNITKMCVLCGFDKVIDLHHLDMNHHNNSVENLTGLCPNHHRMVHHRAHQKEVFRQLKDKGFKVPEGFKEDSLFKNPQNQTSNHHLKPLACRMSSVIYFIDLHLLPIVHEETHHTNSFSIFLH